MQGKPRPVTLWQWIVLYIQGICMGLADIVPGISGGTIAFVMGFYEPLLQSLCTFNRSHFRLLMQGHLREFFQGVAWQFLWGLGLGIATAFIGFAPILSQILNDSQERILLYSSFLGLIGASVIFCGKQVKAWTAMTFLLFVLGACIAWLLTGSSTVAWSFYTPQPIDPWLMVCGSLAVCALLLPGISGSYVLSILGVYAPLLLAVSDFVGGLKAGSFDQAAFLMLANVGVGILGGGLLFSHIIYGLLRHYHDWTIALMTGFMLGAIRAVWPFWTTAYRLHPFHPEKGLQLLILDPYLPSLGTPLFWKGVFMALTAVVFMLILERAGGKKHGKALILVQEP